MIITNLKATVPGAGKTTTAVKLFTELIKQNKKQNLIILTPSNKNKQNIIQMLRNNAVEGAEKYVKTFRDFKKNFKRWQTFSKVYDSEAMEYVDKVSDTYYITTASKFHYKKIWDHIFFDESGMGSKLEMNDLKDHWKIKHLYLSDDLNQFAPIANIQKLDSGDSPVNDSVWNDDGSFYELPIDYQFVLNKSMRAKDEKLNELIEMMKNGELIFVLDHCPSKGEKLTDEKNDLLSENDWNIAYTNAKCKKINQIYKDRGLVSRYIITENDKKHGFSKSEILDADDYRFEKLQNDLAIEDGLSWEEWQEYYRQPAMCVTAHKLQGFTVPENAHVKIHLDDIVEGVYNNDNVKVNPEEMIETIQKFLYIAISRAQRYDQIQVFWDYDDDIPGRLTYYKSISDSIKNPNEKYKDFEEHINKTLDTIKYLDSKMKPLVDEQLQDNPYWTGAADDEELIQKLLEIANTETEALELEGEKEFWQKYSECRSQYTEEDINYAGTHTLKQAKERGWTKNLYYKLRDRYKSSIGESCYYYKSSPIEPEGSEEPKATKKSTILPSSSLRSSENCEVDQLKRKIQLLDDIINFLKQ